jgi:hypothetical protein
MDGRFFPEIDPIRFTLTLEMTMIQFNYKDPREESQNPYWTESEKPKVGKPPNGCIYALGIVLCIWAMTFVGGCMLIPLFVAF